MNSNRGIGARRATVLPSCTVRPASLIPGWTFPIPRDLDGEAVEATYAITLNLVPDEGGSRKANSPLGGGRFFLWSVGGSNP